MRHSIAGRSTVAGTSARAIASLFATASVGAGLTEANYDAASPAICTGFAGHTADGATGEVFRQASLPAAVGGGVIWTFGDSGILIPVGTANGIGVICPTGTGQILDYYFDWDE